MIQIGQNSFMFSAEFIASLPPPATRDEAAKLMAKLQADIDAGKLDAEHAQVLNLKSFIEIVIREGGPQPPFPPYPEYKESA